MNCWGYAAIALVIGTTIGAIVIGAVAAGARADALLRYRETHRAMLRLYHTTIENMQKELDARD